MQLQSEKEDDPETVTWLAIGSYSQILNSCNVWDQWKINMKANKDFILLDSPIIGRVTATAWRQLLLACNSPSPHES